MTYLNDLKKIININSYTKNKAGVDEVSKLMTAWLKNLGFENSCFEREKIGNHNLYTSSKTDGIKILLLGHNDTVFPKGKFENFSEDETWIYGPGVCDMKGGNIVALQALRNVYAQNKKIENIDLIFSWFQMRKVVQMIVKNSLPNWHKTMMSALFLKQLENN